MRPTFIHPAAILGDLDARRGHTANPYGDPDWAARWAEAYDKVVAAGEALLPRFGSLKRRRR